MSPECQGVFWAPLPCCRVLLCLRVGAFRMNVAVSSGREPSHFLVSVNRADPGLDAALPP